jgi:hypothetical protein
MYRCEIKTLGKYLPLITHFGSTSAEIELYEREYENSHPHILIRVIKHNF